MQMHIVEALLLHNEIYLLVLFITLGSLKDEEVVIVSVRKAINKTNVISSERLSINQSSISLFISTVQHIACGVKQRKPTECTSHSLHANLSSKFIQYSMRRPRREFV